MKIVQASALFPGKLWPASERGGANVSCKFAYSENGEKHEIGVYADAGTAQAGALLKVKAGSQRALLLRERTVKGEAKTTARMLAAEFGAVYQIHAALSKEMPPDEERITDEALWRAACAIYARHG